MRDARRRSRKPSPSHTGTQDTPTIAERQCHGLHRSVQIYYSRAGDTSARRFSAIAKYFHMRLMRQVPCFSRSRADIGLHSDVGAAAFSLALHGAII